MTDNRPTLTIAVPCPTCGGTKQTMRLVVGDAGINLVRSMPCPNCTDGTIRKSVSCAGCKWFTYYGMCQKLSLPMDEDFGCLSWEAKA